ncbi:HmuY family protein [Dyadobacter sp. CY343]|uniref:HmuY family protein n=1 Tax=Dyadobacter sp. CY343 TaxID=2907299 RepID=UPI001F466722|nr:HmuY family protein [Dyadobacter sp. CY343]MCE7058677.1 HmuY family protein [Dyadobacter sp. CY343]
MKILILSISLLTSTLYMPDSNLHAPDHNAAAEIIVVKDLNANATPYSYFSFATGKEVPASEAKSTKWDIAFSKTTIAINSGTSGPGQAGAIVVEKPFASVTEAPKDGYKSDSDAGFAIPGGSGNSWYKYDMSVHAILPILGRTILLKIAEGKFVKVEIISYYKGAPEDVPTEESSYYTFRYSMADAEGKY